MHVDHTKTAIILTSHSWRCYYIYLRNFSFSLSPRILTYWYYLLIYKPRNYITAGHIDCVPIGTLSRLHNAQKGFLTFYCNLFWLCLRKGSNLELFKSIALVQNWQFNAQWKSLNGLALYDEEQPKFSFKMLLFILEP